MHYLDANKMAGEEAGRQLQEYVASNIEQVPGGNTPQDTNCTATCLPSRKLSRLDKPDMQYTAGEAGDKLISDVLLWTPAYGRAKAGRLARTYIQQLCEDTGSSPEDLPEAMNDREKWRERVRDICAGGTTWLLLLIWLIYYYLFLLLLSLLYYYYHYFIYFYYYYFKFSTFTFL